MDSENQLLIYQTESGAIEVQLEQDTLWLTQAQMGDVFDTTPENVLKHLKNTYKPNELEESSTTKDFLVVRQGGKGQVKGKLKHYNLDAIISVGYRVNSRQGTQFRIWATGRLPDHLVQDRRDYREYGGGAV